MAAQTVVTPAELATMSRKAHDANSAVQGEISKVRNTVSATSADWQGTAQRKFSALMGDWDSDAAKLKNALDGIAEALSASGSTFDAKQADNEANITSAAGNVGSLNLP